MRVSLMLHSTLLDHIQLLQVYNTVAFYPSRPNIASAGILYCYILPFQTIYSFCRYIILLHSTLLDQIQLLLYIILLHSTLLDHIYSFCMYIILLHSILLDHIQLLHVYYTVAFYSILLDHLQLLQVYYIILLHSTVTFYPCRPNIASAGIVYCCIPPFQTIYTRFCRYIILLHSILLDHIQLLQVYYTVAFHPSRPYILASAGILFCCIISFQTK